MTLTRITPSTSSALDSVKARFSRVQSALSGATTVEAMQRARTELAAISREAKGLQLSVGQEIAGAKSRERGDLRKAS
jgi:hypothetical protein